MHDFPGVSRVHPLPGAGQSCVKNQGLYLHCAHPLFHLLGKAETWDSLVPLKERGKYFKSHKLFLENWVAGEMAQSVK